jgi:S-DNA-T family DNA segregation ATPase FtsK/SpoIIIE
MPAPPGIPPTTAPRWGVALTALPMLAGTVATALLFAGRQGGAYSYVVGAVFGISSLGMLLNGFGSGTGAPKKAAMMAARRDYLRHLSALRRQVHRVTDLQRTGLHYRHPDPVQLWSIVDSYRLWERRPGDSDFGVARVGLGSQTLATPLVAPVTRPADDLEPLTAGALHRFITTFSVVPRLPVAISLCGFTRVYLRGPDDVVRASARALIASLSVFHAPGDLQIAVCTGPGRRAYWDYLKWLPHARHPHRRDALGAVRLVCEHARDLDDLIGNGAGHLVCIVDGGDLSGSRLASEPTGSAVSIVDVMATPPPRMPEPATIVLTLTAEAGLTSRTGGEESPVGSADQMAPAVATALARQLSRLRPGTSEVDGARRPESGWPGLPGAELLTAGWVPRGDRDRLRVPIGVDPAGRPVRLDLKESALDGMGPHGLLVGATGSGKSELLRTLVLGLAATHDPVSLNFVLIDFKGGATFASLDRLPHTAAVITNLREQLPLVDRMTDALNGELVRRQELLRQAGNLASLRDYDRLRAGGADGGPGQPGRGDLAPLPSLLIVCDEFSELLSAKPDFIELFVQIGRLGRSLGMHLLLASQRLEEGRLRGLDTHLSYRIGLRTFSALESRAALGVPDAYELPRSPGHGYLRYGTEPLIRFRAGYVSGPYRAGPAPPAPSAVHEYTTSPVPLPAKAPGREAGSLLDAVVERLAGTGAPAHRVWLPPLSSPPLLGELCGPLVVSPERGLSTADSRPHGGLAAPVALVDRPFDQRHELLWLSLSAGTGHAAIVGGPQSGKSTLLRTVLCGLSLTHTPREVQLYCLDFGGGALAAVRDLPHVGAVAGRQDSTLVRRTVGELAALLAARERRFAIDGIGSVAAHRGQGYPGDDYGDVFLVVDGWATLRAEYDDLEPVITDLATRGLSYGIHVVATASRWMDFRPGLRDLFGSRLELRLGDPADSQVSRRTAVNVPERRPGRGITAEGLHFLAARPILAGDADAARAIAAAWRGPGAPPVRLLPLTVAYRPPPAAGPLPVGLAEADLGNVGLDFTAEPHFLLFGEAQSGKTSFLRLLATSIAGRWTPEQARIIMIDYRRGLLGTVGTDHLIGLAGSAGPAAELIDSAAGYLRRRQPGPDVTRRQLRERSWWAGPDLYVLVDDYDLVAAGPANPVRPLLEHLAEARDVGLHLIVARRSGGAGRALYEPVIQRLRELSAPGAVLSGDRDEGPLLGAVRPQPLPPGRGFLVTRKEGVRLVQFAYLTPG